MSLRTESLLDLTEDEQELIELLIIEPRSSDALRRELGRDDVVLMLNKLERDGLVQHHYPEPLNIYCGAIFCYCGSRVSEFFVSAGF